jgi:hypothetical protein
MSRTVVPLMAFVAALPLVLIIQSVRREPLVDTEVVTATPEVSKQASPAENQEPVALAAAQSEANSVTAALVGSPATPPNGDAGPAFDIARIEPTGEAVIAGRAAPGATVELLRNGELHDQAVADQSEEFTMVPRRLSPGTYDLTLRVLFSRESMAVSEWVHFFGTALAIEEIKNAGAILGREIEVVAFAGRSFEITLCRSSPRIASLGEFGGFCFARMGA